MDDLIELSSTWDISEYLEGLGMDPDDPDFNAQWSEFLYAMGKKFYPDYPWETIYDVAQANNTADITARWNVKIHPKIIKAFELDKALENVNNLDNHLYSKKFMTLVTFLDTLRRGSNVITKIQNMLSSDANLARDNPETITFLKHGLSDQMLYIFRGFGLTEEEYVEAYGPYGEGHPPYTDKAVIDTLTKLAIPLTQLLLENGMQAPKNTHLMDLLDPVFRVWEYTSPAVKQATREFIAWMLDQGIPPTFEILQRVAQTGDKALVAKMIEKSNFTHIDRRTGFNLFHKLASDWEGQNTDMWTYIRTKLADKIGEAKVQEMLNEPSRSLGRQTPVMLADPEMLQYYLQENVDLTPRDHRKKTALYLMASMDDTTGAAAALNTLMNWVEEKYFPRPDGGTDAAWRKALNRAGEALNVKARLRSGMGPLTSVLAETIKVNDLSEELNDGEKEENRAKLLRALQLVILMGAPTDLTDVQESCGAATYEECGQAVENAYDFRQKIETAYLTRPFAPNDPLYPIAQIDMDSARRARARLRERELCAKLSRNLDLPELFALAKYVGYEADPLLSKGEICEELAEYIARGGERPEATVPIYTRPAVHEFILAVENADLQKIQSMLDLGHDPNEVSIHEWGTTLPLNAAISERGPEGVIELLLNAGADPLGKDMNGTPAAVFGFHISAWDTEEGRQKVDSLLRGRVADERKYLHQLFLGQLAALLTVPSLKLDDVKAELDEFAEFGVRFSPTDKVYNKTLLEWVDDEEYGGEKPDTYPRAELKDLLTKTFIKE